MSMNLVYVCLLLAALCLVDPTQGATKGFATYYGAIGSPGCGYGNPYSWIKDGLTSSGRVSGKVLTAAVNEAVYKDGLACGSCYELRCIAANKDWGPGRGGCTGNKVVVMVSDLCPHKGNEKWCHNRHPHFDCAPDAWDVIAKERKYGYVEIEFDRVPCNPTSGGSPQGIAVIVKKGSGQYWQSFALLYVGDAGAIVGLEVSDDGGRSWDRCHHDHGAHWAHNSRLSNAALSFRITADQDGPIGGGAIVLINAVGARWYGGDKTYVTRQNFRRSGGGIRVSRRRIPPRPRRKKGMHCGKGKNRNRPCKKGKKRASRAQSH